MANAARRGGCGSGSCCGLRAGVVDRSGQEGLAKDHAGDTAVAHAPEPADIADPAGDEEVRIVRRTSAAVRRPAPSRRVSTAPVPDQLTTSASSVGGGPPAPGKRREPSGRGSRPDRASHPQRPGRRAGRRAVDDPSPARPWSRRPRTRGGSGPGPSTPRRPGRDRHLGGDGADRVEVAGDAGPGALEVDQVDERRAHRHEPLGDLFRSVGRRRCRPRRPASRRPERPRSRSIAGMTCTPIRRRRQQTSVEADRDGAVAQERVVELAQAEAVPRRRCSSSAGRAAWSARAGTTSGRSGGTSTTGPRPRIRLLEAGVLDEEPRRLLHGDLTAVHAHVEDDPARPPDRVRVEDQAEARIVVEAVLAHHQLGVHAPALDELGGVGEQPRQRGWRDATVSWR